ncbi:MAG: TonB-dependent receptor [Acidobacteria bacterium]|nr:TonB-dependent receptor [Acidobacteriota bacterium]
MMKRVCASLLVSVGFLLSTSISQAQTTFGRVEGVVRDQAGAVLPGVTLTLKNLATGIQSVQMSDAAGFYVFVNLNTGEYSVTASLTGFKTGTETGFRIMAGETTRVDIGLEVGEVREVVTVEAQPPLTNPTSSQLSLVLSTRTVTDLPLIGRDFSRLGLLSPGVTTEGQGGIGQYSVNGQRSTTNTFLVDGTDVNNPFWNVAGSGALGTATPFASIDGIQEYRIMTSTFSAEYGRTSGSVATVVTKSGTNGFHGSAFEFLRNDALNANNYFANANRVRKVPLRFNDFGGSLGGPIVKNRTFFFALAEFSRENRSGFFTGQTVSLAARQTAVPAIQPLLRFLGEPTGRDLLNAQGVPTGFAELNFVTTDRRRENDLQFRVDHKISSSDVIYYRQTVSWGPRTEFGSLYPGNLLQVNDYRNMSGTLTENHVFSPHVVNEFRFGWNRQRNFFGAENADSDILQRDAVGRPANPRFSVSGTSFFFGGLGPVRQATNVFQWTDNLTITHNRHLIKTGVDIRRTHVNQSNNQTYYGSYTFPSVTAFLQNNPTQFSAVRGILENGPRYTSIGIYAQDDFRIRPNLTLNLGLRYELNRVITEVNGRIANLSPENDFAAAVAVPGLAHEGDHNNFAPRVGWSWDIRGNQKTVLRGGFGVFYDVGPGFWGSMDLTTNPPFRFTPLITGADARYPVDESLLNPARAIRSAVRLVPQHNRNPYVYQWNLTLEREVYANASVTMAYIGSRGIKLYRLRQVNTRNPATGQPINPLYSQLVVSENSAQSVYHSLQLSYNHRFSRGLNVQASYTYGHSIDDSSGYNFYASAPSIASNPNNLRAERANSGFDIRHNFIVNYLYDLPIPILIGPARFFANGWSLSGITSVRTGLPYTIFLGVDNAGTGLIAASSISPQRPNYTGQPIYLGDRQGPNNMLNRNAFLSPPPGQFGNLGRNTLRGPGFMNFDFALLKNTRLTESCNLQFRAEFFNLFNHANFGVPTNVSLTTPPSVFGFSTTTANNPREIQFGLKLLF